MLYTKFWKVRTLSSSINILENFAEIFLKNENEILIKPAMNRKMLKPDCRLQTVTNLFLKTKILAILKGNCKFFSKPRTLVKNFNKRLNFPQ